MNHEMMIHDADGVSLHSQLFCQPGAEKRPGVLVFPDAFGLGTHAIARAQRLAEAGYAALACDLHGAGRVFDDMQQMMAALGPLMQSATGLRARAASALQALAGRPEADAGRIAAIGFCIGGKMAFELARTGARLRAAVAFHGSLDTHAPAAPGGIAARLLACIGAEDPMIPAAQRADFEAEMRTAKADWQLNLYGDTVHGFTDPDADRRGMTDVARYSAAADAASWAAMRALFVATID